jgi:hypothetical protein
MYASTGIGIGVALLIVTGKDKIYAGGIIALKYAGTGTDIGVTLLIVTGFI